MGFKELLPYIVGPSRYLGNEVNSIHKDPVKVQLKFALCFPDLYEVGMSHLGLQILYHILNQDERIVAERVFAPDRDLEGLMRKRQILLSTWESGIPLKECDIIGFSIQHELSYTNVLNILNLGGIPIYARQRNERYPLVIAGGPVIVNPEPVSPFIDGFLIGDGEEAILEIANVYLEWKKTRGTKEELLTNLAHIPGFYVPFFFYPRYHLDGSIKEIEELLPNYRVKRRVVKDLNSVAFPNSPIVPYSRPIHDRLSIEVARGCSHGCRFCQAGFIYRPVRERSPQQVMDLVETGLKNTGYEEVSLLSLSIGDCQTLEGLLPPLMDRLVPEGIALSLPSLRVGTISPEIMAQISRVRRTGFTMAPEAGTQEMRNRINKKITEQDLFETAKEVFARKWPSLKLYFMIGLPGETQEDVEAIAELTRRLVRLGKHKFQITISVSTFVPKAHTPFQWEKQITLEESRSKIRFLRKKAWKYGYRIRWHEPEQSFLEGVFSRGDRRLHEVILRAWLKGARFDSWRDRFRFDLWQSAFEDARLNPNFYFLERSKDDLLPWAKIDIGVSPEFLWQERLKSQRGEITPDCRYAGCQDCGLCDFKEISPITYQLPITVSQTSSTNFQSTNPRKYRLFFSKINDARFFGHLELVNIFHRAFKRAGLKLVYSKGFHPLPKIKFAIALPVGVESLEEVMDIEIYGEYNSLSLPGRINPHLPFGLHILRAQEIPLNTSLTIPSAQRFMIDFSDLVLNKEKIEEFHKRESFVWRARYNKKERQVDLKKTVKRLAIKHNNKLEVILGLSPQGSIKITEALMAIFGLKREEVCRLNILKVGVEL